MTIKEAFEYLSSECGIGMKNPFIALRNLVEAFGKVADEIDTSGDYVKKSGDTMTGPLTVEGDVNCESSDLTAGWVYSTAYSFKGSPLGGQVDLVSRATLGDTVQIEIPQKNGTMALTSDLATLQKATIQYTLSDYEKVYSWYVIPAPTDHTYKFVTLNNWSSGSKATSPFSVIYNGTNLYVIIGTVEPVGVTVDFWYTE